MVIIREFTDTDAAQASVVYFESFKSYLKERMEISSPQPPEYWLADGVHPTAAGHRLISDAWLEVFHKEII